MEFLTALTGTFDDAKPSLFELLSESQLSALLPPSLRYLLVVATHRHPRYLLRVLNSFDELYALLMLAVERHYLVTHGGGFVENFYGLKREKALPVGEIPRANIGAASVVRETLKLSEKDIWRNLAVMVGLPYLKRKLDESHSINAPRFLLGQSYTRLPPSPTIRQRLLHYYRWFLQHIYPSVNAAYYFSILAFNIAYLFDNSKYHSPFLWMIGTRMRRLGEADYRAIAALEAPSTSAGSGNGARGGSLGVTSILDPRIMYERALSSLKILLPTSIFALKFLEWWHASDFARQLGRKATEGIELPPPIISGLSKSSLTLSKKSTAIITPQDLIENPPSNPPISLPSLLPILVVPSPSSYPSPTSPPPEPSSEMPSPSPNTCPICLLPPTTPTASQTGYIFCYTCIHRWMEGTHEIQESFLKVSGREGKWDIGTGRCPVSGRRCLGGTGGLRRIMV